MVKPREARTSQEYVAEELRSRILRGEMRAGDRILQAEVARQLAVSNTPVREALQMLASEGLIRLDPHRGAVVAVLNSSDVEEIYMLRQTLEPLALTLAMDRIGSEQLTEADELILLMDQEDDPAVWVDHNRAFHAIFANAAGSPRLAGMLTSLRNGAAAFVAQAVSNDLAARLRGNEDHRELVAAFREKDLSKAITIERKHLAATLETLARVGFSSGKAADPRY